MSIRTQNSGLLISGDEFTVLIELTVAMNFLRTDDGSEFTVLVWDTKHIFRVPALTYDLQRFTVIVILFPFSFNFKEASICPSICLTCLLILLNILIF